MATIKLGSIVRAADKDFEKPQASIEVTAEDAGTLLIQIINRDGKTKSDPVEVGTISLMYGLCAIGNHDVHELMAHQRALNYARDKAYRETEG